MGLVVSLCSAKGSPGVTTSALALTLAWPRRVLLVEADVTAGSAVLAGHLEGRRTHDRGLLGLALALRRTGDLSEEALWEQTLDLGDGRSLMPGLSDPVQATQLATVWEALADRLPLLSDVDVLIDLGRLGTTFEATCLIETSDVVAAVCRCALPDTYALTRRLPSLLRRARPGATRLLTIGPRDPYPPREIARKLGLPLLHEFPEDPAMAAFLSHGRGTPRRRSASPLLTAAAVLAAELCTRPRSPDLVGGHR